MKTIHEKIDDLTEKVDELKVDMEMFGHQMVTVRQPDGRIKIGFPKPATYTHTYKGVNYKNMLVDPETVVYKVDGADYTDVTVRDLTEIWIDITEAFEYSLTTHNIKGNNLKAVLGEIKRLQSFESDIKLSVGKSDIYAILTEIRRLQRLENTLKGVVNGH